MSGEPSLTGVGRVGKQGQFLVKSKKHSRDHSLCTGMEIQKRTTGSGSHSSPVWLLGLVPGRKEKQGRLGGGDRTQGAGTGHKGRGQDTGGRGQGPGGGDRTQRGVDRKQGGVDRTQGAGTGHTGRGQDTGGVDRTQGAGTGPRGAGTGHSGRGQDTRAWTGHSRNF